MLFWLRTHHRAQTEVVGLEEVAFPIEGVRVVGWCGLHLVVEREKKKMILKDLAK